MIKNLVSLWFVAFLVGCEVENDIKLNFVVKGAEGPIEGAQVNVYAANDSGVVRVFEAISTTSASGKLS